MFPIGDDNSDRATTPIVNYAFIGINRKIPPRTHDQSRRVQFDALIKAFR